MRRLRVLVLATAVVFGGCVAALFAVAERGQRCNPDDLTGCDTLREITLYVAYALPLLLLVLVCILLMEVVALAMERRRQRPPRR